MEVRRLTLKIIHVHHSSFPGCKYGSCRMYLSEFRYFYGANKDGFMHAGLIPTYIIIWTLLNYTYYIYIYIYIRICIIYYYTINMYSSIIYACIYYTLRLKLLDRICMHYNI